MKTFSTFKISGYLIAGLFFFLLTPIIHASGYDDVYIQISPKSVVVGEPAELSLISPAGFPEIDKLPYVPGLTWSSTVPSRSTSTSIIQARRISTFSTRYQFTVSKEGTIKIPELKVKIGHLVKRVRAKEFKAYKRKVIDSTGKEIDLDSLLYSSALLKTDRDFIYVGEEIPLEIRMYSVNGLPITRSWPQIDMENVVMKDYSSVNPQSSYFQLPKLKTVKEKGETFDECIFKAALRPISPGTLSGKVIIPCLIKVPREGSRGRRGGNSLDDFFSDGFFGSRYQNLRYKLQADIAPKKVISLPEAPKDAYYTGLVGEWDIQYYLTSNKLKAGEPVTLKIVLKGKGTLDTLSAPEINIEGFRIYPPEIKKEPDTGRISKGEIQYAIIPKSAGDTKIDIAFSTFSPLRRKYIVKRFSREFTIAKGDDVSNGVVDDTAAASMNEESAHTVSPKKERNGLYLKTERSGTVQIPLQNNKLFWIVLMFILGPLVLILSELISYQKQKLSDDPMLRRKNSAKKRKSSIINTIRKAEGEDELHEIIQNDLTPLINDLYGYPPGTSADELAEKVGDPKLSSCLKAGSSSSYMPGNSGEFTPEDLKKNLLKALQKLSVIILMLVYCTSAYAAENAAAADKNDPVAAYDRHDAKTAERIYKSQLDPKNPDPAWIYNIGNCAMQEGNLAKALVYYERARRLDPADSDIRENLNFVRRKLLLPEIGNSNTPIDLLENFRDSFRPDTWMLIIAVTWSMCWLSLALRRRLSNRKWGSALVISLILLALSILAYTSQQHCTYNSRDAIVVKRGVPVYMLPSAKSGSAGFKLRAGEEVSIEEERHQWLRIRQDHSEGWVQADSVKRLWPY